MSKSGAVNVPIARLMLAGGSTYSEVASRFGVSSQAVRAAVRRDADGGYRQRIAKYQRDYIRRVRAGKQGGLGVTKCGFCGGVGHNRRTCFGSVA